MSSLLLKGGRLIDPANSLDETADLLIADGKVVAVGADALGQAPDGTPEIDVTGKVVCPGLIDIHVHFREPGQTAKETIGTGAAAAARGGFTTVVCMPNTSPAIDNPGTVALIQDSAEQRPHHRRDHQGPRRGGTRADRLAQERRRGRHHRRRALRAGQ